MKIKEAEFGGDLQRKSVVLRDRLLRKPLGLVFTQEELANENNQIHLVACEKEEMIGVLLLVPLNKQEIKMRQVAVSTKLQGRGVGKKMVAYAEELGRQRGFNKMVLHARKEPVKFYQKLGYKVIGEQFEEVGIPHFKMEKEI